MKLYLDTCCLHRPFDDRSQSRIDEEAHAILAVLLACESGEAIFVGSDPLDFEVYENPDPYQRKAVQETLAKASIHVIIDHRVAQRAAEFRSLGIKDIDALHLAAAEAANADYFCTCDDRLLRKARRLKDFAVRLVTPLELADEVLQ